MTHPVATIIQLFDQVRSDFDRMRRECRPIDVQLVHTATNVEAEGVVGRPAPRSEMTAFGGAGHRESRQHFDENGKAVFRNDPILDVNGTPITNSAGDALDIIMPAFRTVTFSGDPSDYRRLSGLAERAGRLVLEIQRLECLAFLAGWRFSKPEDLWWAVLFELAWTRQHPLLTADRRLWLPSATPTSFIPYDINEIRGLSESGFGFEKSIPNGWLTRLPDAFTSQLNDVAAASFDASDYLLTRLKPESGQRQSDSVASVVASADNSVSEKRIQRRFAVGLSFPGEHRVIVGDTARELANALGETRVFYDRFHEVELARANLDLLLQRFYKDDSDLIVVFVCGQYSAKEWCGIEWRAIRDLLKSRSRHDEDVMFLRMDKKPLDGLLSLDGFLDVSEKSPREIADFILRRWSAKR